jgi:uncharacterized membrane protein YeaQ/YmgE (transglycosylase-associated protein family)
MLHLFDWLRRIIDVKCDISFTCLTSYSSVLKAVVRNTAFGKETKDMALAAFIIGAAFRPDGLIIWLIIGLIAGFLASRIMSGGGYGMIGDIVVGLIGAFIGGLLANLLIPGASFGFIGSIIVAIIGACILIAIVHAVAPGRRV